MDCQQKHDLKGARQLVEEKLAAEAEKPAAKEEAYPEWKLGPCTLKATPTRLEAAFNPPTILNQKFLSRILVEEKEKAQGNLTWTFEQENSKIVAIKAKVADSERNKWH